ncbi:hypothetical protein PybrP1_011396 [[Pythium] brassicae (nom. inval.)]|nr:hypothetical protein PybrP1_011396 [[Pythium] brassicae (nom. inval.)]
MPRSTRLCAPVERRDDLALGEEVEPPALDRLPVPIRLGRELRVRPRLVTLQCRDVGRERLGGQLLQVLQEGGVDERVDAHGDVARGVRRRLHRDTKAQHAVGVAHAAVDFVAELLNGAQVVEERFLHDLVEQERVRVVLVAALADLVVHLDCRVGLLVVLAHIPQQDPVRGERKLGRVWSSRGLGRHRHRLRQRLQHSSAEDALDAQLERDCVVARAVAVHKAAQRHVAVAPHHGVAEARDVAHLHVGERTDAVLDRERGALEQLQPQVPRLHRRLEVQVPVLARELVAHERERCRQDRRVHQRSEHHAHEVAERVAETGERDFEVEIPDRELELEVGVVRLVVYLLERVVDELDVDPGTHVVGDAPRDRREAEQEVRVRLGHEERVVLLEPELAQVRHTASAAVVGVTLGIDALDDVEALGHERVPARIAQFVLARRRPPSLQHCVGDRRQRVLGAKPPLCAPLRTLLLVSKQVRQDHDPRVPRRHVLQEHARLRLIKIALHRVVAQQVPAVDAVARLQEVTQAPADVDRLELLHEQERHLGRRLELVEDPRLHPTGLRPDKVERVEDHVHDVGPVRDAFARERDADLEEATERAELVAVALRDPDSHVCAPAALLQDRGDRALAFVAECVREVLPRLLLVAREQRRQLPVHVHDVHLVDRHDLHESWLLPDGDAKRHRRQWRRAVVVILGSVRDLPERFEDPLLHVVERVLAVDAELHGARRVVAPVERDHCVAHVDALGGRDRLQRLAVAPAERVVRVSWRARRALDLLQPDVVVLPRAVELGLDREQLALERLGLEEWRDEELRKHVERRLQVARPDLKEEARRLALGRAVAVAPVRGQERLERVLVRVLLAAHEQHVLEVVREPADVFRVRHAAHADCQARRRVVRVRWRGVTVLVAVAALVVAVVVASVARVAGGAEEAVAPCSRVAGHRLVLRFALLARVWCAIVTRSRRRVVLHQQCLQSVRQRDDAVALVVGGRPELVERHARWRRGRHGEQCVE